MQLKRGKTELKLHRIGFLSVAVKNTGACLAFGKHTHRVEVKYHTRAMCDRYVPYTSFNYAKSPYEFFICLNPWRKITVDLNMDNHDNTLIIAVDYSKDRVAELTLTAQRIFARLQKGNFQKKWTLRVRSDPGALDVCKEYIRVIREQPHIIKRWRPNIPLRPRLASMVECNTERTSAP